MTKPRAVKRPGVRREDLSETDWQRVLVLGLEDEGWTVNHIGRARTAKGDWVTPTTSSGWPDLIAVKAHNLLAVEVKDRRRPVEAEQVAWLLLFATIPTARAWVLRPTDDWQAVAAWIKDPDHAPVMHGFDPTMVPGDPAKYLAARKAAKRSGKRSAGGSHGVTLSTPPGGEQGRML